jgi:hypothetical protein
VQRALVDLLVNPMAPVFLVIGGEMLDGRHHAFVVHSLESVVLPDDSSKQDNAFRDGPHLLLWNFFRAHLPSRTVDHPNA